MKKFKASAAALLICLLIILIIHNYSAYAAPSTPSRQNISGNTEDTAKVIVATVNTIPITAGQLLIRVRLITARTSYHGRITDKQAEEINNKALNELITEELVYQEAKKKGIKVSEKEIDSRLKEIKKRYRTEDAFNNSLAAVNLDLNSYKRLIEKELAIKKIKDKLFGTPIKLSEKEVKEYYEKNKEKFREPEKIRLRQILIKVAPYASKEGWDKGLKKAEDILTQLQAGKDFAKLAKEFSDDPSSKNGGDMGFIHKGRLEPDIENVAYALKVGEVSDVMQTIYGYHIIKVEEKRPARNNPFSKVKEKLKKDLEAVEMEEKKEDWVKKLKEKAEIKYNVPSEKKD